MTSQSTPQRRPSSPAPAWALFALALVGPSLGLAACTGSVGPAANNNGGSPGLPGGTGNGSGSGTGGTGTPSTATGGTAAPVGGAGALTTGGATGSGGAGATAGTGGGGTTGSGGASSQITPAVPQTFRRLTVSQFQNSLKSLLGDVAASPIEEDTRSHDLAAIGATQVVTSPDGVEKYQAAIDTALDTVFADATRRVALVKGTGCPPKIAANDACTRAFIASFGRMAWRRALSAAELTRYATMAGAAQTMLADPYAGARWAASALLQSPNFLYRVELGQPLAGRADLRQLTSTEMATRLAYFLWDAPPDEALLVSGESGQLTTVDGIRTQAQRLLNAPLGRNAITSFVRDFFWLRLLDKTVKDAGLYPAYTPTLRTAMGQELVRMWEAMAFEQDGSALDLFTTRRTFVNKELATLYGLPITGLTDTVFTAVNLPTTAPRAGFLGTAALLVMNGDQKEGSPTLRGRFIREQLLCQIIPPPPDDVDTTLPEPPVGVMFTKREKLDLHRTAVTCAACHALMDPLGFPLESFDAIGKYRTTDAGKPIDASGSLNGTTFNGLPGLAETLKATPAVTACLVKHIYRYATGSAETQGESVAVGQLMSAFANNGYRLKALLTEIVANEGFRLLTPAQP